MRDKTQPRYEFIVSSDTEIIGIIGQIFCFNFQRNMPILYRILSGFVTIVVLLQEVECAQNIQNYTRIEQHVFE